MSNMNFLKKLLGGAGVEFPCAGEELNFPSLKDRPKMGHHEGEELNSPSLKGWQAKPDGVVDVQWKTSEREKFPSAGGALERGKFPSAGGVPEGRGGYKV